MCEWRRVVLVCLALLLVGCGGGSGSTGLVTSEDAVIDDVRRNGTCDSFDGATYCATGPPGAVAPGGQSVSVLTVSPTPLPTFAPTPVPTPTGGAPTPTFGVAPTSTPAEGPTSTPGVATPDATATPSPTESPAETDVPLPTTTPTPPPTVTLQVDGFAPGAACATAARPAGSDDLWRTSVLVPVGDGEGPVAFPLRVFPPADVALLCFDDPPASLPPELATLTDAEPTVVFVLPEQDPEH